MAQEDALQQMFLQHASYGTRQPETQLDSRSFVKVFKDSQLMDKKLSVTDLDIIFSKVKAKAARKISYDEFLTALPLVAEKKDVSVDELKTAIATSEGPVSQATQADYVKFHDDKSTFTGVYARGGPTNVDGNKDLSQLCDRTPADARGVSSTSKFSRSR